MLRRSPAFASLWAARVVSFLGDAMATIALILHVADEEGTGAAVSALLIAEAAPRLLAPAGGWLCDRVDQRRLLWWCELGQGLVMAAMALWLPGLGGLVALVALRSVLFTTVAPAGRSVVADLVDDQDLPRANSLLGAAPEIGGVVGPVLAGVLFAWLGVRGVLAVDAATFLIALPLLARLPPLPPTPPSPTDPVRPGFGVLLGDPVLRVVCIGFVVVVLALGLDDLVLAFLGEEELGAGSGGIGVLYAAPAIGLLLGYAFVTGRVAASGLVAGGVVVGLALASAGNLATGLAPVLAVAVATQAVRGVGNALIDVGVTTLVQRRVARASRGRAFGLLFGAVDLAATVSYAIGGPLLDATSPRVVLVGAGSLALVVTAVMAVVLRYRAAHGHGHGREDGRLTPGSDQA